MKKIVIISLVFCSFMACTPKAGEETSRTDNAVSGALTIATVDTDTIFAQYDMVVDVMAEIEAVDKKLSTDLQGRAKSFQTDYENYLKIGATMTLSEQKKKEEQLTKRQQELQQLEQRYTEQLMQTRAQKNQEVQDRIFDFISEYNKSHGNYGLILSKSRTSGVMCSSASMDITQEVLTALNEDYAKNRKKK